MATKTYTIEGSQYTAKSVYDSAHCSKEHHTIGALLIEKDGVYCGSFCISKWCTFTDAIDVSELEDCGDMAEETYQKELTNLVDVAKYFAEDVGYFIILHG